jgi:hypothetical protein
MAVVCSAHGRDEGLAALRRGNPESKWDATIIETGSEVLAWIRVLQDTDLQARRTFGFRIKRRFS